MDLNSKNIFKTLNPNKVIIPFVIGGLATAWLLYKEGQEKGFSLSVLKDADITWLLFAVLVLVIRDAGYIYRIRYLTDKELSWKSSFYSIILWEFASSVTPFIVGGTSVATFILFKEGLKLGKALAIVMVTAILDNCFFIVVSLGVIIATKGKIFPADTGELFGMTFGIQVVFYASYFLILFYTFIMAYALFWRPRAFKWLLLKITSVRWLRKWRYDAYIHGDEIIWASAELRGKKIGFWLRAFISTIFIWSARYFIVNCVIAIFVPEISLFQHLDILAKHLILWVVMLISPTPGSAGSAELGFLEIFGVGLSGYGTMIVFIWRFITYWLYLIVGIFFLSRWIRRVFPKMTGVKK